MGQTKVSVLERCPSYRGYWKHWHPTKRAISTAECERIYPIRHKNSLLEQIEDLSVSCKQRKINSLTLKIAHWGRRKCPSYGGIRLTVVRLTEVFLWERHLSSAGASESVRLREVSVLWDNRLKRLYCIRIIHIKMCCLSVFTYVPQWRYIWSPLVVLW